MHKGVSEYLLAPVDAILALTTLSSLFDVPGTDPLGRTIAFVGAKGGVGSSSVAHNVAWAISQDLVSDVVIADLDLAFGTAGLDFNQDPPQGMAEAVFAGERLDENYLDRLFSKCTDHLSLITAPSTLEKEYDLPRDSMEQVIELIRKTVPTVVLDVPHVWTAWSKATLLGADDVVITAVPDLANLRNAKNLIDLLKQARPNDRPPIVLLNQVGVPKKPEISEKDFGAALELQPFATIGFDPVLFANASNNGQMIAELGTSHTYVWGGDTEHGDTVGVGVLGATMRPAPEARAFRFERVLRAEPWETGVSAPLTLPYANVQDVDSLFATNGKDLRDTHNVYALPANPGSDAVLLTVGSPADRTDVRDIRITTLSC